MFPKAEARPASPQGRNANTAGRVLESRVESLLKDCGYAHKDDAAGQAFYIPQYRRFKSIYGTDLRVDFYVWHPTKYPNGLVIECKSQESPGSVDEKYPYALLNLKGTECAAILIVEGNGPKAGAIDWCRRQENDQNAWFRFFHGFLSFQKEVNKKGLL